MCCAADKPLHLVNAMSKAEKRSIYVVYPGALFDGWEVVKEHSDNPAVFDTQEKAAAYAKAQAVMDGGGVVKLENWLATQKVSGK